ncbi:MAG: hypothetical protein GXO22_02690 [Aquificae bacterium]|nr:hypothetical protein [Aquificota bacterium]
MEHQDVKETLKKMAVILDKVAKKVDELDKRVSNLEQKLLSQSDKSKHTPSEPPYKATQTTSSAIGGSFLGSLLGSLAGLSIFNILFNNDIPADQVAKEAGFSQDQLEEIEKKLDEISNKIDNIEDTPIEPIPEDTDYINTDESHFGFEESIDDDLTDFGFDDPFEI